MNHDAPAPTGITTESVAERHRRLASTFHATVAAVPAGADGQQTPCEGWTIADVVEHVTSTQLDFLTERGVTVPVDPTPAAVSAALQEALNDPDIANASYDSYFGPTTLAETVDAFYCLDLVVHRWDIASAAGLDVHATLSDADIERCRRLLAPMGDNIRMPGIFAPAIAIDESTTATEQFIAWTGRRPQES